MDAASQLRTFDEMCLRNIQYRGALQLARLLQEGIYNPDFYSVEKSAILGGDVVDDDRDFYNLHELADEIRIARSQGCIHLAVEAHYLLPGGKGEASITLVLDD